MNGLELRKAYNPDTRGLDFMASESPAGRAYMASRPYNELRERKRDVAVAAPVQMVTSDDGASFQKSWVANSIPTGQLNPIAVWQCTNGTAGALKLIIGGGATSGWYLIRSQSSNFSDAALFTVGGSQFGYPVQGFNDMTSTNGILINAIQITSSDATQLNNSLNYVWQNPMDLTTKSTTQPISWAISPYQQLTNKVEAFGEFSLNNWKWLEYTVNAGASVTVAIQAYAVNTVEQYCVLRSGGGSSAQPAAATAVAQAMLNS